jgi:hypothetical protein
MFFSNQWLQHVSNFYLFIYLLGVLRGLPRDFGVGPPSHHQSASAGGQQQQPGSRGNRGNNRSDVSIQVSRSPAIQI